MNTILPQGLGLIFDSNKSFSYRNQKNFDTPEHTWRIANETSPNRSSNILPNFFLLSMVVSMYSSFLLLAPESRDLSQAEKEIIGC